MLGALLVLAILLGLGYLVWKRYGSELESDLEDWTDSNAGGGGNGDSGTVLPSGPGAPPVTTTVTPSDYDKRIENWDDRWRFRQPDTGTVSFDVTKPSGLIVCLSTRAGYAQDGYAVVIDARGSGDTDPFDDKTSVSYVSRLPQINGAISTHANARGVELAGKPCRITVSYRSGYIEAARNGVVFLRARDRAPTPGVSYVAFGHTGLKSGVGLLQNIVVE